MKNSLPSCSIVITLLVVITTFDAHVKPVDGSVLSFCDGTKYVEKTREQCGAGLTFGENKPDCICVSGIYRFIADSCETADGFADTVCTKLSDENGFGANIIAVKFAKDPQSWAQTGVVADRKGFGTETWEFITDRHSRGSTTRSTNIYALNGRAFMVTGHHAKQAFCVEQTKLPESEKICRYLKHENKEIWKDTEVEIMVTGKCDGNPKPLMPHKCFGLLRNSDSECTLNCSPASTIITPILPMGRSFGFGGNFSNSRVGKKSRPGESIMGRALGQTSASSPAELVVSTGFGGGETSPVSPVDPGPVDYWRHDNKFLNRKMMIYNIISQLSIENSSNTTYGEPKLTFELFEMMKDITTSYCTAKYVWPEWINMVIQLFYVIHKGNLFKYDEPLVVDDYEWIKDILTKCHERVTSEGSIELTNDPTLPDAEEPACRDGGKATGFCNGTKPDGSGCQFVPVALPGDRVKDSFHYVPEVAWDVVDIIQVICFPEFNVSYRMFHVLEQAAEKLFTLQIKNLWYYPTWSDRTKKRLLGTSADIQLHNLEVCLSSAYYMNGMIPRLLRPRPVKYLRKKRAARNPPPAGPRRQSVGSNVDVYCSKSRKEFMAPMSKTCSE